MVALKMKRKEQTRRWYVDRDDGVCDKDKLITAKAIIVVLEDRRICDQGGKVGI